METWPEPAAEAPSPDRPRRPARRIPTHILVIAGCTAAVGVVALAAFLYLAVGIRGVEAVPTDSGIEWIVICQPGGGTATADEHFSGPWVDGLARNRGDLYVERVLPGTRVWANVEVRSGNWAVSRGRYKVYGTIRSIDPVEKRVVLSACVFENR